MRLLLDHCVPRRLAEHFRGYQVSTATEMGWERLRNGELLAAAGGAGFEMLITVDRNLRHQQNLAVLPVAVIIMCATSNDIDALKRLVPRVMAALRVMPPRSLLEVEE